MLLLLCFSSLQLGAFWPDCPSVPLPNTTAGPQLSGWLKSPALRALWLSSYCGTSAPKWAEFPGRLTEDKLPGEKDAPVLTQIVFVFYLTGLGVSLTIAATYIKTCQLLICFHVPEGTRFLLIALSLEM